MKALWLQSPSNPTVNLEQDFLKFMDTWETKTTDETHKLTGKWGTPAYSCISICLANINYIFHYYLSFFVSEAVSNTQ